MHVIASQDAAYFLGHQDQRIRHQHLLEVVALVQVAEEQPFEDEAEQRGQRHAGQQLEQELVAEQGRQGPGQVGADHVEAAMGEVDDAHDAEDEGQAAGDEEQQQAVLHGVEALCEEGREVHDGSIREGLRGAGTSGSRAAPPGAALDTTARGGLLTCGSLWPDRTGP